MTGATVVIEVPVARTDLVRTTFGDFTSEALASIFFFDPKIPMVDMLYGRLGERLERRFWIGNNEIRMIED